MSNFVPTSINRGGFLDYCAEKNSKAESEPNGSVDQIAMSLRFEDNKGQKNK